MREVVVEGVRVLVARLRSGEVCAASPSCPHEGAPLAQGTVRQAAVDCPRHHYLFDLKTGENLYPVPIYPEWKKQQVGDLDLRTFPAYESDGWIWVIRRSGDTRAEG
jgi:3-phenylpropionate/trans-cinnamate dioxygenase ferredoxin subunit